MSEKIELVLPKPIYDRLRRKAEEKRLTIQDLLLKAIIAVIEDKV